MGTAQTEEEKVILHTTYFGSVDWYRQLICAEETVYIDACENYIKQTSRNRCEIATANGKQILTVPVTTKVQGGDFSGNVPINPLSLPYHSPFTPVRNILVSEHGNWRHQHWEALKSAYGMSPFFDYYQDDIRPFFDEEVFKTNNWQRLFDYNLAIMRKMLDLIGVKKEIKPTPLPHQVGDNVLRQASDEQSSESVHYYQTFQKRHGFIPGLSILDLLFNEGPEAILYLKPMDN